MSQEAIALLEEAVVGLQRTAQGGHYEHGIDTPQFARIMFQAAHEAGVVRCEQIENSQLQFVVGDERPRIYPFPFSVIRQVLAAVAYFVCSHYPDTPGFGAFNVYGDSREVEIEIIGQKRRFHVQTANGRKLPYGFAIRRLSENPKNVLTDSG